MSLESLQLFPIEEYALRCVLQLAKNDSQKSLSASKIAELEGISVEYVSKVMFLLRNSGVVLAKRGTLGGFYLHAPAHEISIWQVLQGVRPKESTKKSKFCEQFKGLQTQCVHHTDCSLKLVWEKLQKIQESFLASITLKDLIFFNKSKLDFLARQMTSTNGLRIDTSL